MQYRTLGRAGFDVSAIGHGLWGMGDWSGSDDAESARALDESVSLGCNFFDSAWAYGEGKSDTLLGDLVERHPDRRLYVASKLPPKNLMWPGRPEDSFSAVFPADHCVEYAERIREALRVDCVDLLQFHVWDDAWAGDPEFETAVGELKSRGLAASFGISLNRWEPANALKAIETGLVDVVQVIYNIFDQAPEDELFPACEEEGVGVIARVPFDEGSLTGTLTKYTRFPDDDWRAKYFGAENLGPTIHRVEELRDLLPSGMSMPELALRFILSEPRVHTTIAGMRRLSHVQENLAASEHPPLEPEVIDALREHRWDRIVTPWAN
jgi:aryl-alcohol dehydrogenase-like predicted oxidoreductase